MKDDFLQHSGKTSMIYPHSIDEISNVMKSAIKHHQKIQIQGNGTQNDLGGLPEPHDLILSTKEFNRMAEYDVHNLTVTVESGITLKELQRQLNEQHQFLPLDPPGRENSTVGGIVAANASGPRRFHFGTCKDLILGMSYVLPDGTPAKIGGKTMKNVAGYEMSKLFIGSMGTLGAISHVTFRLFALPQISRSMIVEFTDTDAFRHLIQKLLRSKLVFSSMDLFNASCLRNLYDLNRNCPLSLFIRFEGDEAMVNDQIDQLAGEVTRIAPAHIDEAGEHFWRHYQAVDLFSREEISLKISLPIAKFFDVMMDLQRQFSGNVALMGHAGNGILYAFLPTETHEDHKQFISNLRRQLRHQGGQVMIYKAPPELKRIIDVWGNEQCTLFRKIKDQIDPCQIIVRGRFVGGL